MGVIISLRGVTKVYPPDVRAVDGVSLDIEEGEILVLVGPSGCGKSTVLMMVNRLLDPTEGSILLEGQDIRGVSPVELRRGIGYVIQEIGLFPHMTVFQNICVVPRLLKWSRQRQMERAVDLLKLAGLDPGSYGQRYPKQLSGGEQQRVGVLRALAADPKVCLMDEPFGALDPIARFQLQAELKSLQTKLKKTILFVTHDMDEAVRMANRVALMRRGRLVQVAPPQELIENPADDFVVEFLGHQGVGAARSIQSSNGRASAD